VLLSINNPVINFITQPVQGNCLPLNDFCDVGPLSGGSFTLAADQVKLSICWHQRPTKRAENVAVSPDRKSHIDIF